MILDASVVLKALLPENGRQRAEALVFRDDVACPDVIDYEVASGLTGKQRERVITSIDVWMALDGFALLPMTRLPSQPHVPAAVRISLEARAQFYDCLYLALAIERDDTLITADGRFVRAVSGTIHAQRVQEL